MLRRPLLFVAAAFAAAIFVAHYIGIIVAVLLSALIIFLALLFRGDEKTVPNRIIYRRRVLWLLCVAFAAGTVDFAITDAKTDPALEYLRQWGESKNGVLSAELSMTGTVREISTGRSDNGERYLQLIINWRDSRVLMRCYREKHTEILPGDTISASGRLQEPAERRNPNSFDYRLYLRSRGIRTLMTADTIRTEERASASVRGRLYLVRSRFADLLEKEAGSETAALMQAIMFGDKGELDEEMVSSFQKNGTAHILAVSGLHIGIIYAFLLKVWGMLPFIGRRRGVGFMTFIAAFFGSYMIMASFSPSVVRAVCMVMLHVFAQISGRRYDMNSAAFLVMTAVLICNPFMLFNTGFQMSFLAVLTMALILPYVQKVYSGLLLSSLAVQIGIGPFLLYNFNYLSLLAVFINVPVIFLTGIIVPLGICDMLAAQFQSGWTEGIAVLLSHAVQGLCMILQNMNSMTAAEGLTVFRVASPDIRLLAAYYAALAVLASEEGRLFIMRAVREHRISRIAKAMLAVLLISLITGDYTDDGFRGMPLTFIDVGQGDCILIQTEGRGLSGDGAYLIDGGGSDNYNLGRKILAPTLLKNGISHVDGAFVSHLHTDHYKGICELAREGMVGRLYVYEGNKSREEEIARETGLDSGDISYLAAGDRLRLGPDTEINVIWPEKKTDAEYSSMLQDEDEENEMSMVFTVSHKGLKIMTSGDMDESGERQMIAAASRGSRHPDLLQADILKAGHHGSRTSTSDILLNYAKPKLSVIQLGKNTYGHPAEELLQRLRSRKTLIYRNDLDGAVGIDIEDGRIKKIKTSVSER